MPIKPLLMHKAQKVNLYCEVDLMYLCEACYVLYAFHFGFICLKIDISVFVLHQDNYAIRLVLSSAFKSIYSTLPGWLSFPFFSCYVLVILFLLPHAKKFFNCVKLFWKQRSFIFCICCDLLTVLFLIYIDYTIYLID